MEPIGKVTRIYIRHADKEYANGDATIYKHDPGITERGVQKTKEVAQYLLNQWGVPDRIIVSPYRRTRETAKILKSAVMGKVPVFIDRDVSEYLGNHRTIPIDVTESTLVYDPPHPETFTDMKIRVRNHNERINNFMKRNGGVVWIVTHGLIMKQVAKLNGIRMPRDFPNLTCLSITDKSNIVKGSIITFHEGNEMIDTEETDFNSDENTNNEYLPRYEIAGSRDICGNRENGLNRENKWDSFKNTNEKE